MNKADLLDALEARLGSRRAGAEAVETIVDLIIREVAAGGKVAITGFGTFEPSVRAARTGRNPRTGQTVRIDATTIPRFRPGTQFKDVVADPAQLPASGPAGARATAGTVEAPAPAARRPAAKRAATRTASAAAVVEEPVKKARRKAAEAAAQAAEVVEKPKKKDSKKGAKKDDAKAPKKSKK